MPLSAKRVLRTFRYAIYFDGIDDQVQVPYNTTIDITDELTVSVWLNQPGVPPKYNFSKNPDAVVINIGVESSCGWRIRSYGFYGKKYFEWNDGTSKHGTPAIYHTLYSFFHIASVYSSSNRIVKTYYNGSLSSSSTWYSVASAADYPLRIGIMDNTGYWFSGYVYNVLIYHRALSNDEIMQLYSRPDNPPTNGLVLWFKAHPNNVKDIDGDGVLEWIDLSGNNNHGKIYGAVLTKVVKDPIAVSPSRRVLSVVR